MSLLPSLAAVTGNKDVARLLMRLGADANVKDRDGKTTLMIAVVNGHQGMVELLLEMSADVTIKNEVSSGLYHTEVQLSLLFLKKDLLVFSDF